MRSRGFLFSILVVSSVLVPATASAAHASWDPRIEPIAHEVEKLRGLQFRTPVPVIFLKEADFVRRVVGQSQPSTTAAKVGVQSLGVQLSASGLTPASIHLGHALTLLDAASVVAFYDPQQKAIFVRGTTLGPDTKITLAHELTHALQDQNFDLARLAAQAAATGRQSEYRDLVEGDAVRVQDAYVDRLPDQERASYRRRLSEGSAILDSARAHDVPTVLEARSQAPYVLAPAALRYYDALSKTGLVPAAGVDGLFASLPRDDAEFLTPTKLMDPQDHLPVHPPRLAAGDKRVGQLQASARSIST